MNALKSNRRNRTNPVLGCIRTDVLLEHLVPNGAKAQLLIYTNINLLLDLCILLGLFDRGYGTN
jgi:hypothetical protein